MHDDRRWDALANEIDSYVSDTLDYLLGEHICDTVNDALDEIAYDVCKYVTDLCYPSNDAADEERPRKKSRRTK